MPSRRIYRPTWCRNGFTLIELLVVISIITLLIAILVPSLRSAREQARMVKCLSNMRGMGQSGMAFTADNNGRFQVAANEQAVRRVDPGRQRFRYDNLGEIVAWNVAIARASGIPYENNYNWGVRANDWNEANQRQQYMSDDFQLTVCPSDPVKISTPFYPRDLSLKPLPPELKLPNGNSYWGFLSYGINEDIVGVDDTAGPNPDAPDCWRNGCRGQIQACAGERLAGQLERIFDPGTCLLLVDAGPDNVNQASANPEDFANLIISAQNAGPNLEDFQLKWRKRMPLKRHPNGSLNVLFTDFHGETVKPVSFYENDVLRDLPQDYNTRIRISPYRPWVEE